MIKLVLTIFTTLFLISCATKPTVPVVPSDKTVKIALKILEECDPLEGIPEGTPPELYENILLQSILNNIIIYRECANKQHNSIIVIKELSNIKDSK